MPYSLTTIILGTLLAASSVLAQQTSTPSHGAIPRLHVRPHEMATGTRTERAGLTQLPSFAGYYVYVPEQCVGTKRSPLVVLVHGGGVTGRAIITKLRSLADKYGFIVFAPNALQPGRWDVVADYYQNAEGLAALDSGKRLSFPEFPDVERIDEALQQVLQTYAIDPNRIALTGFSNGGAYSFFLGRANLDIFSRIAALSAIPAIPFDTTGPRNPNTQFLVSGGIGEERPVMISRTLRIAQTLRQEGHLTNVLLGLRPHVDYVANEDYVWGWIAQSWAHPTEKIQPIPPADSDPILTVEALQKMTTFWTHFRQEPDSVLGDGRMAHQERIALLLGQQPVWVVKTDMVALAAQYPSVAADLKAAGLTAQQEEAYRAAIIRVGLTREAGKAAGTITPGSILEKNLAFRESHEAAFAALGKTGMWIIQ
jgi:predicted esterase